MVKCPVLGIIRGGFFFQIFTFFKYSHILKYSWKLSRKSLWWVPRTMHMSFRVKSGLKWPILGRIRVFSKIHPFDFCLRCSPIITQNFRKIFRADSENRVNKVFGQKLGQKRPSLEKLFFLLQILGCHFFRSIMT